MTWLNTALMYFTGNLSSRISREVLQVSKQKNKLHKEQPCAFPLKHESQKTMEYCIYRKLRYDYYNLIYMRVKKKPQQAREPLPPNNWCKPQQSLTWRAPVAFHGSLFSHNSQKTPLRAIIMSGYFSAQNPLAVPNSPLTSGRFPSAGNELCHCYVDCVDLPGLRSLLSYYLLQRPLWPAIFVLNHSLLVGQSISPTSWFSA